MTSKSSTFFLFSAIFYHYKGPRQTKLSGVIPCQKFFGEPVLITTFSLSGRFYHRSKKDVLRLSMTTVTYVDCLNIITIRLSIAFNVILNKKGLSQRIPFRRNKLPFLPWLILHISFSNSNAQSHHGKFPMHNNRFLFIQV